jgi:hypothetical protein
MFTAAMYVWVSSKDARKIVNWAMEHDSEWLADRFCRAARADSSSPPWESEPPPPIWSVWRWRSKRPIIFRCYACDRWEAFRRHGDARKSGWQTFEKTSYWIHGVCASTWDEEFGGREMNELRALLRRRQEAHEFLFGDPRTLEQYKGVFVRAAPWDEHTHGGLLDGPEADLQAEGGEASMRKVIDEMPETLSERLVAVGFQGFSGRDLLLLGWAESIPPEYDGVEFDGFRCNSVLVHELPSRELRKQLPDRLRAIL